jgi:PAS domain S-box-containing protein
MEQLTGIAAGHVLGAPLFEKLPAWADELAHLASALAGSPARSPTFLLGLDATYLPHDDGALAIVRERDRALGALREAESRFRIMADTSPVLLWMSGTDGLCTFFNERWLAFTGRPMERELGSGWAEGVHHEDFQRAMDHYLEAFVARREFRIEYRLRRADGEYRWLLDTGVPRFLPSGVFAGYIGCCIDIPELKRTRDELDRRVRERTAELEAFAYSVSHDLRAPLRHIDGFSQALLEQHAGQLDAEGRHVLERVRLGARRMGGLIDDLLQLSRIGRQELDVVPCDLSKLARSVASSLHGRDPDRTTEIAIADGLAGLGDPRLLKIALDNLLGNAWKFTSKVEHGRIEVTSRTRGNVTEYVVRDNGVGFDMAHAAKLFAPFQRLHREDEFPGTGIGLAIAHRIITRHGGQIRAESCPGAGATFAFTLPVVVG